jgi:hypothetical protein
LAARKRRKRDQQDIQLVEPGDDIRVTKKDAALQQILAAIQMHFAQGQPVPICTLVNAAHDICVSVIKAMGGSSTRDELEMMVRPEFRDSWRDLLKRPYNFFKHGSKSADDALAFNPASNDFAILQAILDYRRAFGENHTHFDVFVAWHAAEYPDTLADQVLAKLHSQINALSRLSREERLASASELLRSR